MTEWLAIPPPGGSDLELDRWLEVFSEAGYPARIARDDDTWLEVPALMVRGYVALEGNTIEAINFEVSKSESVAELQVVVEGLGWELYPDDGEDDD